MMEVYFDNAATTRCFDEVGEIVLQTMQKEYGNPSSLHLKGIAAEKYIKQARESIAKILKINEKELIFTSGGTESNNLAVLGCAYANQRAGKHLITTKIEHQAILQPMKHLEEQGFRVTYLPVDKSGNISLHDLESAITEETILVSIMHVNNEIGSVQPLDKIGKLIKEKNPKTLFHVDDIQGFGKYKIYPKKLQIDVLSVSGHKIHAPKGIGFLFVGNKVKIKPIVFGGGHQNGLRSGTENVSGIAGIGKAAEGVYRDFDSKIEKLYALKELLIEETGKIEGVQVNGLPVLDLSESMSNRIKKTAPHIVSLSFRGIRSEVLLHSLEEKNIYVSAGSACSSAKPSVSETLKAIGIDKELLYSTIRISLSDFNTKEEAEYFIAVLNEIVPKLRKYTRH